MSARQIKAGDMRLKQGKETRRRILETAGRCFARNGYDRTSVRDLVTATGVSRGNIFYHFDSKQHLFLETIRHFTLELGTLNRHFEALFAADVGDRQHLADLLHQSVYSFMDACLGPGQVEGLVGLYLRVLSEGDDAALAMLFGCFSEVQANLPVFFRRVKPGISDSEVGFLQQLLWSLLQYPVVSQRLVCYDMKMPQGYTEEYLRAAAWHLAKYCCLALDLPPPREGGQ